MRKLMRYNDYKNDPLSLGNPAYAISSRGDLGSAPSFNGGIDSKVFLSSPARQRALWLFSQQSRPVLWLVAIAVAVTCPPLVY